MGSQRSDTTSDHAGWLLAASLCSSLQSVSWELQKLVAVAEHTSETKWKWNVRSLEDVTKQCSEDRDWDH
jgi:hypothetical protein